MKKPYIADLLPIDKSKIDIMYFVNELIDASAKIEVFREKIKDSKLNSSFFLPTLQWKEALTSSQLEGTQATLDGVYINQVLPNQNDKNLNEVSNYIDSIKFGYRYLMRNNFSNEFFFEMHKTLMSGNVRKPQLIGEYRKSQNFIGKTASHEVTFVPPIYEEVPKLMNNLIDYMNESKDDLKPLIKTAIIHAQFESIHPFLDGNGRVGRMLITFYLYYQKQIDLPFFFLSEALEQDKILYYNLLNNIRIKNDWNEWIKFFLANVAKQCDKYISIINEINNLYERDISTIKKLSNSSIIISVFNELYKYPIVTAKQIAISAKLPLTSVSRYLNVLVENKIIISNHKQRNREYFYLEMLSLLR